MLRRIQALAREEGLTVVNVFHAGDGNLHPIVVFDGRAPGEIQRVVRAGEAMLRLCVEAGGTITGEHGVGFEKNAYMPWIYSEADLRAMQAVKRVFDPEGIMNPWKVFPAPVTAAQVLVSRPHPPLGDRP